jgi:hypothetical protein
MQQQLLLSSSWYSNLIIIVEFDNGIHSFQKLIIFKLNGPFWLVQKKTNAL